MKKFSTILLESVTVALGEEEPLEFDDGLEDTDKFEIPIIVNGIEYSTDEIKFLVEPRTAVDNGIEKTLYRFDIWMKPELRGQGIGYKIFKEFVLKYGNVLSIDMYRENEIEIPKIFDRLSKEPGFNTIKDDKCTFIYTNDWAKENGNDINLDLFNNVVM